MLFTVARSDVQDNQICVSGKCIGGLVHGKSRCFREFPASPLQRGRLSLLKGQWHFFQIQNLAGLLHRGDQREIT